MTDVDKNFTIIDYLVFVGLLVASSLIGVYYWFKDRKTGTNAEYLVGGRNLAIFPVAMSLAASFMSTNTILGVPSEVYMLGTQICVNMIAYFIAIMLAMYVFMPIYYDLKLVSINKYLLRRFHSNSVRIAGSVGFILATMPYMGVVLYGPSLALSSVTPLSIKSCILVVGVICTFYTTVGGIKAVIWTDVIQCMLMLLGLLMVIVTGTIEFGSVLEPFRILSKGDRLVFFNPEFNIYRSDVFWSVFLGCLIGWTGVYCVKQTQIQRYCCLESKAKARKALWLHVPVTIAIGYMAVWCGVIIYAKYHDCDPILTKQIERHDQLMPYYVMDTLGHIPGLPGVFVACVFSGALSTLSSGFNALATVTWDDFFKRYYRNSPEKTVGRITKIISAVYGLISICIAFVIGRLGTVMQASMALAGAISGPLLGLFFLGVFFPFVDFVAALAGIFSGFGICVWISIGSLIYPRPKVQLPVQIDQCPNYVIFNYPGRFPDPVTSANFTLPYAYQPEGFDKLYHISYWMVPAVGFTITLLVGISVGLVRRWFSTKKHLPDRRLVSPLVVWLIGASYGDTEITLKPDDSFEEEKKSTEMSNNETQETLNMTKITKLELNSPA